jgi:acyl-CoA thioesterase FadM
MRLRFRLIRIILSALLRRKNLYLDDVSVLNFIVMPTDCVFNLVGNDRYHSFMDLGRLDLLIRHGGWHMLLFEKMQPFVFSTHVRYCMPLKMFQPFVLHTRLIHWSNTSFWMEHVFKSGRKTVATAISKNGFTYRNKVVPTEQIFNLLNGEKVGSLYPEKKISVLAAITRILRDIQTR